MVHLIRNSFFVYKCGPRQQLPSLGSVQAGSPLVPLGQPQPPALPSPPLPAMLLPPLPPLKVPRGHKPPSATCLPPATMRCLASLALALLALKAALRLAPALTLPGRPRRVILNSLPSRCAPETLPDLAVW